jgi:hypothetical protein
MKCSRINNTNGEPSILFDTLYNITKDEVIADELYAYFRTSEFYNLFGDYREAYSSDSTEMLDRLDDNYEPLLIERKGKYYFKDKNGEKVYYPYGKTGLHQYFNTNDLKIFTKSLALNFYKDNIKFEFDSLEFINTTNVSLEQYAKEYIDKKAKELQGSDNIEQIGAGIALEQTSDYINEWIDRVNLFYNSLKLEYNEDIIEDLEEQDRENLFKESSFLSSNKNNVSNNIKLFLSLIESNEINKFNEYEFVDFDDIYSTLNKSLNNIVPVVNEDNQLEDSYDLYLDVINKLVERKPYIKSLYDYLSSNHITDLFKSQFVSAFNLHYNNFLVSEISKDNRTGDITYNIKNVSEVSSRKNVLLAGWFDSFEKKNFNTKTINEAKVFNDKIIKEVFSTPNFTTNYINFKEKLKKALNNLGVETTNQGLELFLNNNELDELSLQEKKSKLIKTLQDMNRGLDYYNKSKGNLFTNQAEFKNIAQAEAFFIKEGSDASVFTVGKTKWLYSYPSYLGVKLESWKSNINLLEQHYNSIPYNQGSYYMEYYLNNPEKLAEVKLNIFNALQEQNDSTNATDGSDISYIDSLADHLHKILAYRKGATSYAKTPLAGDKSTEIQISYGNELNINTNADLVNGKINVSNEVLEIFYNYFKADYNRIAYEYNNIKTLSELDKIVNYHTGAKNAFKSQVFPELSDNSLLDLYDTNNEPLYKDLDQIKDEVKESISNLLSRDISKVLTNLNKYDLNSSKAIDKDIMASYNKSNQPMIPLAADFFVNSMISQVEFSKMFSGDVAYYKNFADYRKRIPGTQSDGQYIRVTEGNEYFNVAVISAVEVAVPSLENMKKMLSKEVYEKYLMVNSTDAQAWITPERWKFIMQGLGKWSNKRKATYNKFFDKNAEFTTEELKFLAQPLKGVYFDVVNGKPVYLKYSQAVLLPGLIKGTPLQKIYDKMTAAANYNDQIHEVITEDGIKVGAPIPTATHDANGNITDFEFNPFKLTNQYWKLQQDLPTKGIKDTDIGSQIQKNIFQGLLFNTKSTFTVDGKDYTNEGLIDHLNELFNNLSGQERIKFLDNYGIDDNYTITNEDKLVGSIIKQLKSRRDIPDNVIEALESDLSPYGIPGYNEIFQNVFSSAVNDAMVKLKTNGGSFIQMADYGLTKDETVDQGIIFTPWFETKKLQPPTIIGVNPVTGKPIIEPGGIFISGSFIAKIFPEYKKYKPEQLFGTLNAVTGKYEGGIIDEEILTNIIGYRIPNQALASSDALQIMGILPEGMGDTIIPYIGMTTKTGSDFDIDKMFLMIPSFKKLYKHASKIRKYAVTYLRGETLADTLNNVGNIIDQLSDDMVDISVDELAEMIFSKKQDNLVLLNLELDNFINAVFNNPQHPLVQYIKESIPDYNKVSKISYIKYDENNPSIEGIKNRIIEVYKSILTHPDVINDVMNPIDVPHIKNDIRDLNPEDLNINMYDSIYDINLKLKFKLGKAGLGQIMNFLVDYVRGSMGNLTITDTYLGWGKQQNGITKLDHEYSTIMTDADLASYSKSYSGDISNLKSLKKMKVNETFMGYVNGFVDIAKDPFIIDGNWTPQTNNVGLMLLRASAHPFYINAFLSQPILKEYVDFRNKIESKIFEDDGSKPLIKFKINKVRELIGSEDINFNNVNYTKNYLFTELFTVKDILSLSNIGDNYDKNLKAFIGNIRNKLIKRIGKENTEAVVKEFMEAFDKVFNYNSVGILKMSIGDLRSQIKNSSDLDTQLSILDTFEDWVKPSKSLAKSVRASRVDVDGKGKNINSLIIASNTIQNVILNEEKLGNVAGFNTKLTKNGRPTILQSRISNSIDLVENIFKNNPKYFALGSKTVIDTFNLISYYIYGETLQNDNLGNKLEKAYYTYLMSGFKPLIMTSKERTKLLTTLPSTIKKYGTDNALLNELYVSNDLISMSNIKKSVSYKNDLIDGWRDLFQTDPTLAEDLVKYSFLISGFNNSVNQFHEYIPHEWFNKNRFNSYLKSFNQTKIDVDNNFVDQFFRNRYLDATVTKKTFKSNMKPLADKDFFRTGYINTSKSTPYFTMFEIFSDFNPNTERRYYKLAGYNEKGESVYLRTSVLENEYNVNENPYISLNNKLHLNTSQLNLDLYNSTKERVQLTTPTVNTVNNIENYINTIDPSIIYLNLGNKTQSENVVIKSWNELKDAKKAITPQGIISTRLIGDGSNFNFGNPFASDKQILSKTATLIPTNSTEESVKRYIEWIINGNIGDAINIRETSEQFEKRTGRKMLMWELDKVNRLSDELQMRRNWILEQIESGELKGKPILYYKELGEPSHATALDYLINKYNIEKDPFNKEC